MKVDLKSVARGESTTRELERLSGVYGTLERLQLRVGVEGCSNPDAVDDLELWKALRSEDCVVERLITYQSPAIFAHLTPRRLDLLQRMAMKEYPSIRSLAEDCGRDYKNVYDDLTALKLWGLVSLVRRGRCVRPSARVVEMKVTLD